MTNRITEGRLFLHQRSGLKENNYDTVTGKIDRETNRNADYANGARCSRENQLFQQYI